MPAIYLAYGYRQISHSDHICGVMIHHIFLNEVRMKLSKMACGAVVLAGSMFATDAFADASHTGFEGIVQLSAPIIKQEHKATGAAKDVVVKHKDVMAGFNATLSVGYRFNSYAGAYLEQDLGGHWWTGDTKKLIKDGWFIGGTYIVGRGLIGLLGNSAELDFKIGIGMMYSDGKKGEAKGPLFPKKNGDPTVAFAMKFGAGFTYYVMPDLGIGVQLDYNLGIHEYDNDGGGDVKFYLHHINPGVHVRMGF